MKEEVMTFEPGEVVMLKSGGQPMTVVATDEEHIDCIWIGEEGNLFRESIPAAALIAVPSGDASDDEEGDEESDDEDEADDEDDTSKRKRKVA
jgi:uncharacterized protein YodC (DUF2158 family)